MDRICHAGVTNAFEICSTKKQNHGRIKKIILKLYLNKKKAKQKQTKNNNNNNKQTNKKTTTKTKQKRNKQNNNNKNHLRLLNKSVQCLKEKVREMSTITNRSPSQTVFVVGILIYCINLRLPLVYTAELRRRWS